VNAKADEPVRRRRGENLENALLEAAWDELVEVGYAALTMDGVATRAGTSRAVLYRRWARKDELALAAFRHYGQTHPIKVPDTGSLRGDLLALLREASIQRLAFAAVVSAQFNGILIETGATPADVRSRLLSGRPFGSNDVFERARERGELDLDRLPESVLMLPLDLLRHDMVMTLKPITEQRLIEIVDEIFLPLVARYASE
jgi:AcrR family transcriptional regulator